MLCCTALVNAADTPVSVWRASAALCATDAATSVDNVVTVRSASEEIAAILRAASSPSSDSVPCTSLALRLTLSVTLEASDVSAFCACDTPELSDCMAEVATFSRLAMLTVSRSAVALPRVSISRVTVSARPINNVSNRLMRVSKLLAMSLARVPSVRSISSALWLSSVAFSPSTSTRRLARMPSV